MNPQMVTPGVLPSTIVKHPGRFDLVFPDGSALKNCLRRTYITGGCEWYVFHGRQFHKDELERWGAQIVQTDTAPAPLPAIAYPCPKCGAQPGENCRRNYSKWLGGALQTIHAERRRLAGQHTDGTPGCGAGEHE